jgi:hypothetical protein
MATIKALGTDNPETLQRIIRHCDADCERLRAANPTTLDIASACLYWTKYPMLLAIIGDDRQTSERCKAYDSLYRAHRHAAELLCAVADREGIDGGAIYSAAEICRELFCLAPNAHRDGHFPYAWPDCLGLSRKDLPEHDQKIIRDGSTAYIRLVSRLRIQLPPDFLPPDIPDPDPKLIRQLTGNSRALAKYLWKRGNVSLDALRRDVWEGKPVGDRAIDAAVDYCNDKLSDLGYKMTRIEKCDGLYYLRHPEK